MKPNPVYDIIISMKIRVFILAVLLMSGVSFAGDKASNPIALRDAKEYIDTIEKVTKLKLDDQIDVWQTFLSDHPQQTFRKEIEHNIELLQSLSLKKQPGKQGDERDAELYLKALEFSKKLSQQDQISMWQQFLDENPTSIYRNEAISRLTRLQRFKPKTNTQQNQAPRPVQQKMSTPVQPSQVAPSRPVSSSVGGVKPIKDPDQALLLASLPGLVVPAMGHWYTQDYVIAGVLSAIRLIGFGIAIPGVINSDYSLIYLGGGVALLSYVIDVADAGSSADRYNEDHSPKTSMLIPAQQKNGNTIPLFAYSFKF